MGGDDDVGPEEVGRVEDGVNREENAASSTSCSAASEDSEEVTEDEGMVSVVRFVFRPPHTSLEKKTVNWFNSFHSRVPAVLILQFVFSCICAISTTDSM